MTEIKGYVGKERNSKNSKKSPAPAGNKEQLLKIAAPATINKPEDQPPVVTPPTEQPPVEIKPEPLIVSEGQLKEMVKTMVGEAVQLEIKPLRENISTKANERTSAAIKSIQGFDSQEIKKQVKLYMNKIVHEVIRNEAYKLGFEDGARSIVIATENYWVKQKGLNSRDDLGPIGMEPWAWKLALVEQMGRKIPVPGFPSYLDVVNEHLENPVPEKREVEDEDEEDDDDV